MTSVSKKQVNSTPIIRNLNNKCIVRVAQEDVETTREKFFNCVENIDAGIKFNSLSVRYSLNINPIFINLKPEGLYISGATLSIGVNYFEVCNNIVYTGEYLKNKASNMEGASDIIALYNNQEADEEYDVTSQDFNMDNYGIQSISLQVNFVKIFRKVICSASNQYTRSISYSQSVDELVTYDLITEKVKYRKYQ